jgi:hypothetical protein
MPPSPPPPPPSRRPNSSSPQQPPQPQQRPAPQQSRPAPAQQKPTQKPTPKQSRPAPVADNDPLSALANLGGSAPAAPASRPASSSRPAQKSASKSTTKAPTGPKAPPKKSPLMFYGILGGVIAVIGIVLAVVLWPSGNSDDKSVNNKSGANAGGPNANDPTPMLDIEAYIPEFTESDSLTLTVYNMKRFNEAGPYKPLSAQKDLRVILYTDDVLKPEELHDVIIIHGGKSKSPSTPIYKIYHTNRDFDILKDFRGITPTGQNAAGFDVFRRDVPTVEGHVAQTFIAKTAPNIFVAANVETGYPQFQSYLERVKSRQPTNVPESLRAVLAKAGGPGDYYSTSYPKNSTPGAPQYIATLANLSDTGLTAKRVFQFKDAAIAAGFAKDLEAQTIETKKAVTSFTISHEGEFVSVSVTVKDGAELAKAKPTLSLVLPF